MPLVLDQIASALDDWLENEGRPFMFDDKDYKVGAVPVLNPCKCHTGISTYILLLMLGEE